MLTQRCVTGTGEGKAPDMEAYYELAVWHLAAAWVAAACQTAVCVVHTCHQVDHHVGSDAGCVVLPKAKTNQLCTIIQETFVEQ